MNIKRYVLGMCCTNCYLLIDEKSKECAIIDPGSICFEMDKDIEYNQYTVKYIIFTHGHFDHIGGLEYYMNKYSNSLVLMHKMDIESILIKNEVFFMESENLEKTVKLITLQNDGDEFLLGLNKLTVIHTPGHSRGSVCIYSDGILFSGDTLFFESVGRTDFYDGDFKALEASVKKLYRLPGDTIVYPGHGDYTAIDNEKNNNPFVRF